MIKIKKIEIIIFSKKILFFTFKILTLNQILNSLIFDFTFKFFAKIY